MDYEQKYKEALNKAQKELQCCGDLDCDAARQIFRLFPELRESDNERISREITKFLVNYYNGEYERPNENTIDSWLSWLKKQGEQKPADKIEPKFKEGDYVANDDSSIVAQIEGVSTNGYYYTFKNIKPSISYSAPNCEFVDKYYHLWTIEDAKDGDVLFTTCNNTNEMIFIYHGIEFMQKSIDSFRSAKEDNYVAYSLLALARMYYKQMKYDDCVSVLNELESFSDDRYILARVSELRTLNAISSGSTSAIFEKVKA